MDTLAERFIAWFLRSIATAMLLFGVAMLVAGIPLFTLLRSESPLIREIAVTLLQLAGVFLGTGVTARYFLRPRGRLLPNEQRTSAEQRRPTVDGWLMGMAVAIVAVPLLLVVTLQPFLAECRRVYDLLESSGVWDNAHQNMAGIVLIPIFGALTPPLLELATLAAYVGTSVVLFPLLCTRSHRFPRFYVVCFVFVTGLALASLRAVDAVNVVVDGLRQLMETTSGNPEEAAMFRDGLSRYTSTVGSAAPPLMWAWLAYLIWLPPLFSSPRAQETFASPIQKPIAKPETARDIAAITAPPRFPGF